MACQYDLRGLTTGVCPECGRGFDPDDARTFDHALARPRMFRMNVRWAILGSSMPLCLGVVLAVSRGIESAGYDAAFVAVPLRVLVLLFGAGIPVGATLAFGCVIHALALVDLRGVPLAVGCALLWLAGMWLVMQH
ncbi:MAG: hypothetical protein HND58_07245 [Planctomycetota bacterium]|nr:MAG: hypothetical protein HND58_07245 [Planctomycetota bacterium]